MAGLRFGLVRFVAEQQTTVKVVSATTNLMSAPLFSDNRDVLEQTELNRTSKFVTDRNELRATFPWSIADSGLELGRVNAKLPNQSHHWRTRNWGVKDRPTFRALKVWKTRLAIQPQLGESSRGNMHLQKEMLQTNQATSINNIEIQQVLFRNSSSARHLVDEVGSKSASNTVAQSIL